MHPGIKAHCLVCVLTNSANLSLLALAHVLSITSPFKDTVAGVVATELVVTVVVIGAADSVVTIVDAGVVVPVVAVVDISVAAAVLASVTVAVEVYSAAKAKELTKQRAKRTKRTFFISIHPLSFS